MASASIKDFCRELVSSATIYKWRAKPGRTLRVTIARAGARLKHEPPLGKRRLVGVDRAGQDTPRSAGANAAGNEQTRNTVLS
jgi:hypothetical protein